MFKTLDYEELQDKYVLIDVRSPGEYNESTIPGAVNIPLFDDEERKVIGTVYVQESVEKAKRIGLEVVGKKLPQIYDKLRELEDEYEGLVFFCARGGMRSSAICALMMSMGFNVYKLRGGYKGYRKVINEKLPLLNNEVNYVVLHGNTGVGKTEILKKLREDGYDILDLEAAANHRGSLLGSIGLGRPRSQKQFEAMVFDILRHRKNNRVFVEAESRRVGNIVIPAFIWNKMQQGIHILVEATVEFRANLILMEYMKKPNAKDEILEALSYLEKHMSKENGDKYKEMAIRGEYKELAKLLMVKYYDPLYASSEKKYEFLHKVQVVDIKGAAKEIEGLLNFK